jgi:hypothetical protein
MQASQKRITSPFFALTSLTLSAYLSRAQIERGVGRLALWLPWTTAQPPARSESKQAPPSRNVDTRKHRTSVTRSQTLRKTIPSQQRISMLRQKG